MASEIECDACGMLVPLPHTCRGAQTSDVRALRTRLAEAERRAALAEKIAAGCVDRAAEAVVERDAALADAEAARRDYRAVAEAAGVMYEADGHNSEPGPVDAVVQAIGGLRDDSRRFLDALAALDEAKRAAAVARESEGAMAEVLQYIAMYHPSARDLASEALAARERALLAWLGAETGRAEALALELLGHPKKNAAGG